MARTIAVFTGNRAEYGLQQPVLAAIDAHPSLEYQLIVAGAHLEPDFGRTLCEIKADGFVVHAEVKADLPQDTLAATPRAIWNALTTAEGVESWWVDEARLDARPGGRIVLMSEGDDGEPLEERGLFHGAFGEDDSHFLAAVATADVRFRVCRMALRER